MLKWEKNINGYNGNWTGGYIGFEGVCPLYKVDRDDNGWYYEYLPGAYGVDGFESAEEAKTAVEVDYKADCASIFQTLEKPLTPEELDEVLGDRLYDERKEEAMMVG